MKNLEFDGKFLKDLKLMRKRGYALGKLELIIAALKNEERLPAKNKNHKLKGNYALFWECHIEPDWLLIYRYTDEALILFRTGTHSDLF